MSNLNLVTSNFAVSLGAWMGTSPRIRIVDFTPVSEQAAEWARDRTFYLFGGSGNTLNSHHRMEPEQLEAFKAEDRAKLNHALDEIEADPERFVKETETSLRLMDGFLEHLEKPSLKQSITTSLYGEKRAYFIKALLRSGTPIIPFVMRCINRSGDTKIWVSPHITPYIPYSAMLFIRPDFIDEQLSWIQQSEGEFLIQPCSQETSRFDSIVADARRMLDDPKNNLPEFSLVSIWNEVHTQALARIYGSAEVYVRDQYDNESYRIPYESEGYVLSLQKDDERALRLRDVSGFILYFKKPLWEAVDFALISTIEMFENGIFRFMLIDHQNSDA